MTGVSNDGAVTPNKSTRSLTILVVDDDRDMRDYVRACLRPLEPRRVDEASSVREALDVVKSAPPDLIIADVVARTPDGEGLFSAIRSNVTLSGIRVLLVDGSSTGDPVPADAVLRKPFNAAELQATVARLFDDPVTKPRPVQPPA